MALDIAVVTAVAEAVKGIANIPIIEKFLENWSHRTINTIDDWLVDELCDVEKTQIPARAAIVQAKYDALSPEEKLQAKTTIVALAGDFDGSCQNA